MGSLLHPSGGFTSGTWVGPSASLSARGSQAGRVVSAVCQAEASSLSGPSLISPLGQGLGFPH